MSNKNCSWGVQVKIQKKNCTPGLKLFEESSPKLIHSHNKICCKFFSRSPWQKSLASGVVRVKTWFECRFHCTTISNKKVLNLQRLKYIKMDFSRSIKRTIAGRRPLHRPPTFYSIPFISFYLYLPMTCSRTTTPRGIRFYPHCPCELWIAMDITGT